ncbi:Glutamate receptor ionotropic, NMDA 1-like 4, partial [Homarus americanus]
HTQVTMVPPCYRALLIAALMMSVPLVISREADGPLKHRSVDVGLVVAQTMKHHLTSCQVILITTSQHSHVFSSVLRHTSMYLEASLVVEAGLVFSQDQLAQDHLLQGLWGDSKTTCRALILDLTINTNNTQLILSLLEAAGMWQLPETRVVVVGLARRAGVKAILLHHSFRNTAHVLYLAMHYPTLHILPRHGHLRLNKVIQVHAEYIRVRIYRRYEIRESPGRAFGDLRNGQYTGNIGKLQREEADFCTIVAPTRGRLQVSLFARLYQADKMVITSLKPTLLPAHLSLVRPFEGELWLGLLVSVLTWGVVMWVLHRASQWFTRGRGVKFSTALMYGWGAVLEQPPSNPCVSDSGR